MGDFSAGELGLEQILQRLMDQYQPQATPAASSAIAALPRLRVASTADLADNAAPAEPVAACRAGDPCTVCHDDFEAGAEVMQLPCKHCFHQDCLLPWLDAVSLKAPSPHAFHLTSRSAQLHLMHLHYINFDRLMLSQRQQASRLALHRIFQVWEQALHEQVSVLKSFEACQLTYMEQMGMSLRPHQGEYSFSQKTLAMRTKFF